MTNVINRLPAGQVEPGRTHLRYRAAVRRRRARIGALVLFVAVVVAAVCTLLAGPVGLAWGIAYLAAEAVGALIWQPLDALYAECWQILGALVRGSLVDTVVFVALLDRWLPLGVAGQMLGKTEAVLATGAVLLATRRLRGHLRLWRAGGRHG